MNMIPMKYMYILCNISGEIARYLDPTLPVLCLIVPLIRFPPLHSLHFILATKKTEKSQISSKYV